MLAIRHGRIINISMLPSVLNNPLGILCVISPQGVVTSICLIVSYRTCPLAIGCDPVILMVTHVVLWYRFLVCSELGHWFIIYSTTPI